jgi:uncharacterized protein (PEP-CTERM system associated)
VALKLALTAVFTVLATSAAQAQFDSGGYTSTSTPQARYQQADQAKKRRQQSGVISPDETSVPLPDLQVFAAVSLAETYTSNAGGNVNGDSDFYTEPGIHLGLIKQSRRVMASFNYSLTGQYHARNHDLDQFINKLSARANAELLEQLLYLDLQAAATPQALTRVGSLTASSDTPTRGNYRNTYSYAARPTIVHQFGNAVETDLWVSQSGVFFVTPSGRANSVPLPGFYVPPTNSNTTSVGARIAGLSNFTRLMWSLNAQASDTYQASHQSQKTRSAIANLGYLLTDDFSIIGTGGYQTYHSSYLLTKDLDGPTLLGGFRFVPSPNFYVYAQAGTQNNFPTYIGELTWGVSPLTRVNVSASDQVQTPQQELVSNLQNPGSSSGTGTDGAPGTMPGGGYGLGSGLGSGGLAIDNSIYRNRTYQASVSHSLVRTEAMLAIFASIRDRLNALPSAPFLNKREENYGLHLLLTHSLRRDLTGRLGLSASRAKEFNGHDYILEGDAGLSYNASETLSFYTNAAITHRQSDRLVGFSNRALTDVRVTVGVRKSIW